MSVGDNTVAWFIPGVFGHELTSSRCIRRDRNLWRFRVCYPQDNSRSFTVWISILLPAQPLRSLAKPTDNNIITLLKQTSAAKYISFWYIHTCQNFSIVFSHKLNSNQTASFVLMINCPQIVFFFLNLYIMKLSKTINYYSCNSFILREKFLWFTSGEERKILKNIPLTRENEKIIVKRWYTNEFHLSQPNLIKLRAAAPLLVCRLVAFFCYQFLLQLLSRETARCY